MPTLTEAVEADDKLAMLEALRGIIIRRIADGVNGRDLAALTRLLVRVVGKIEAERGAPRVAYKRRHTNHRV
jgi:hypothetical protein